MNKTGDIGDFSSANDIFKNDLEVGEPMNSAPDKSDQSDLIFLKHGFVDNPSSSEKNSYSGCRKPTMTSELNMQLTQEQT